MLGRTGLHSWVGTDGHCELSGQTETDRMDFLRLRLPGLHQALRGALVRDSRGFQPLPVVSPFPPSLRASPQVWGLFLQSARLPGFQSPAPTSACMYSRLRPCLGPYAGFQSQISYLDFFWCSASRERAKFPLNAFTLLSSLLGFLQRFCVLPHRRYSSHGGEGEAGS